MSRKEAKISLDEIDRRILNLLQTDASLTIKEIAEQVHLSTTPCWKRVQRLEQIGVIKAKVALLDPKLVDNSNTVFILLKAKNHDLDWNERFAREMQDMEEILEVYRMSGEMDFIIRAAVADIQDYDRLLKELMQRVECRDINSMFAIEEIKFTTALPLKIAK